MNAWVKEEKEKRWRCLNFFWLTETSLKKKRKNMDFWRKVRKSTRSDKSYDKVCCQTYKNEEIGKVRKQSGKGDTSRTNGVNRCCLLVLSFGVTYRIKFREKFTYEINHFPPWIVCIFTALRELYLLFFYWYVCVLILTGDNCLKSIKLTRVLKFSRILVRFAYTFLFPLLLDFSFFFQFFCFSFLYSNFFKFFYISIVFYVGSNHFQSGGFFASPIGFQAGCSGMMGIFVLLEKSLRSGWNWPVQVFRTSSPEHVLKTLDCGV